jgi:hypothetical protein
MGRRYRERIGRRNAAPRREESWSILDAAIDAFEALLVRIALWMSPAPQRFEHAPPPRPMPSPPRITSTLRASRPEPPPLPSPTTTATTMTPTTRRRFTRRETTAQRLERIESTIKGWQERGTAATTPQPLPFRPRARLHSKGERAFWYPLFRAVKGRYRVFCKVRLADVVSVPDDFPDARMWFQKIGNYHVDFVICEPKTTQPLLVVELDDRSHRQSDCVERDRFKDAVLGAAGVPLLRVKAATAYDPLELTRKAEALIAGPTSARPK